MTPAQTPERPVTPDTPREEQDQPQREMTLAEWMAQLPIFHRAHREYVELLQDRALPPSRPAESTSDPVTESQASAWFEVVAALNEVDPDWMSRAGRGVDAAVASIRFLASAFPVAPEGAVAWMFTHDETGQRCTYYNAKEAEAARGCFAVLGEGRWTETPLLAHPLPPSDAPSDGPFGAETALRWLVERCSHPHDAETQAMAAVVRASLARVPASPSQDAGRRGEVERMLRRYTVAVEVQAKLCRPRSEVDELHAALLALYGVPAHSAGETK